MRAESQPSGQRISFIEAARRQQIIEAAVTTVNELGYHGASLAQIAARAGISKSIISYHFDGKEDLLLAVVNHVFARAGEQIEAAVGRESTASGKLAAYARAYLNFIAEHRAEMIAAMEVAVSHRDADGVPLYLTESEEDTALLMAIVEAGQGSGEFRTELDPIVTVTTIVHALDGALTRAQMHPDTDLATWVDHLVPMLLAALGAQPRGV